MIDVNLIGALYSVKLALFYFENSKPKASPRENRVILTSSYRAA